MLHDAENDKSLVLMIFQTEDDYRVGDAFPGAVLVDTPGLTNVGHEVRRLRPARGNYYTA